METALLIVNLEARSVSKRVKEVITKALAADLKLEVADTAHRHHATELARDAADRGFDLVISFGGDGTMNEAANGLVGTGTALTVLPGGMANVLCRAIGVPDDIVEATGHLLNRIQASKTRKINVGRMDGRYFVMSCGIGLDAATVRRVEDNPGRKKRFRDWFFIYSALQAAFSEYRGREPYIHLQAGEAADDVLLAVISNTPHFTYFKRWPVTVAPDARLEGGLDVMGMRRFPLMYIPRLTMGLMRTGSHLKYKHTLYEHDVKAARLVSADRPFPIQVDGEFVGDRTSLDVELVEDGLTLLT